MDDYNTAENGLQQEHLSEPEPMEVLTDEHYPWKERKMKTVKLAKLYQMAGMPEYADRAKSCATWLEYMAQSDGSKQLYAANFCHLRLCPMCLARRAKKAAYKLSQVLDVCDQRHKAMYLFLTLTVRNVDGEHLGAALGQLTKAWDRLMRHRQVARSVKGWFRAIEITRKAKGYHPHIHAILAVEPEYFGRKSGLYISHDEWVRRWQMALGVDYKPSVRIQTAKAKGEYSGGRAAAVEAAKYAVKDSDYIDPHLPDALAVEIVRDYTNALHRRRLTAFGGWLKAIAAQLDAGDLDDGDLIHVDETRLREDVAELIEEYNWHFGAGDYILTTRRVNPLRVVREEVSSDDG